MSSELVIFFDVDNTLLDNDRVQQDLHNYLVNNFGDANCRLYWEIFEQLRSELGYADYLGALQRYRLHNLHEPGLLKMSSHLVDYPFHERLYPHALEVVAHFRPIATVAVLSDGDVVFQPRKVHRSGIWQAVEGRVLIYIHKEQELCDVVERYPAEHYVLVDDKLRILHAVKTAWGSRVTTVFPRQGHYAHDEKILAEYPLADINIKTLSELLSYDSSQLVAAAMTQLPVD